MRLRLVLGCVVAEAATLCAFGAAWVLSPRWLVEPFRIDSFSSLLIAAVSGLAPIAVGSLLILAKTRRDRRYAALGLGPQLAALFLAAVWAQWTGLAYRGDDAGLALVWYAAVPCALEVTWMLLLLFNVDRSRESYFPWRGPAAWISSDRY